MGLRPSWTWGPSTAVITKTPPAADGGAVRGPISDLRQARGPLLPVGRGCVQWSVSVWVHVGGPGGMTYVRLRLQGWTGEGVFLWEHVGMHTPGEGVDGGPRALSVPPGPPRACPWTPEPYTQAPLPTRQWSSLGSRLRPQVPPLCKLPGGSAHLATSARPWRVPGPRGSAATLNVQLFPGLPWGLAPTRGRLRLCLPLGSAVVGSGVSAGKRRQPRPWQGPGRRLGLR